MRMIAGPLAMAVACLLAPAAPSAAPRERSIYVTVEEHGRPVTGLGAADFELELDEAPVPFRVEPAERPANVVVLAEDAIDTRYAFGDDVRRALRGFAAAAAGDRYALVTFARTVATRVDFTDDPSRFEAVYQDGEARASDVNLSDAVLEIAARLQPLPGRHAIVVLATGAETSGDRTGIRLRRLLDRGNVVVFVCALGRHVHDSSLPFSSRGDPIPMDTYALLHSLASETGGSAWFPAHDAAIDDAMCAIAGELAHQYRLVFETGVPADGKLHDLDVRAYRTGADGRRKRLTVRAKRGWRVEGT